MNEKAPSTPAEWLTFFGEVSAKHPLVTITEAGEIFEKHCAELLRNAGEGQAAIVDLQADLLTILPRLLNSITRAEHAGSACAVCASRDAAALYAEIVRDMSELAFRQNTGGTH
jgi:hypothetical protein